MAIFTAILIGLKEVWAHKTRSLLTMLGIILGVASLVTMAAMVKGMENGMKEAMIAMGGLDKIRVSDEDLPPHQEHLQDRALGKRFVDVEALERSAPLIRLVSPEMELNRAFVEKSGKRTRPSDVIGVLPAVLEMNLYEVEHGRFFTDLDEDFANSVCVIGTGIRDELFGAPQDVGKEIVPIGETININDQPFTIVGMFKHYESEQARRAREQAAKEEASEDEGSGPTRRRGWRSPRWDAFWRKNNVIYIPLNTMWVRFRAASGLEGSAEPRLDDIDIKIDNLEDLEPALQQARNVLMITHEGIEDFTFRTQENQIEDINKRIRNSRISGGIIAALSLLVGGIGIMNIMLASINERIREIGTCKALGATGPIIFLQILVESCLLALMGAICGVVASYVLVEVISALTVVDGGANYSRGATQNLPVITMEAIGIAVLFSVLVGVAAGIAPAAKAARLDPIQALRYE